MKDPILSAPIEDHLRPSMEPGEAERMLRSFKLRQQGAPARRAARRRRVLGWASGGALALAAAAALLLVVVPREVPGPLSLEGGHSVPHALGSDYESAVYDLDDGSRIVLAPETDAHVVANDESQMHTTLGRGRATFDVRPGGPRRWIVEAGDTRVEVLGTRFSVDRHEGSVEVRVERGVVEVHHPSLEVAARLTAGQSIQVAEPPSAEDSVAQDAVAQDAVAQDAVLQDAVAQDAVAQDAVAQDAVAQDAVAQDTVLQDAVAQDTPQVAESGSDDVRSEPRSARPDAWRARAERGDFVGAYRLLGARGLRERASRAEPDELLLLADVARRAGHPHDAAPLLAQVVRRGAGDPRALVAAFTLGRLQLDRLGTPAEAAESFAFVREHGGALREDAIALEATARSRAGQRARARAIAAEYLSAFPEGRRAASMRRLVDPE